MPTVWFLRATNTVLQQSSVVFIETQPNFLISHHGLRLAECHVCLDHLQHVRGDFIYVLQGPDAKCHNRPVVLTQEEKCPFLLKLQIKKIQLVCHL